MHPSPGQILQQHLRLVLRLPYAAQESLLWTWELPKSHPGEFSTVFLRALLQADSGLLRFIGMTQKYLDGLFCLLPPPSLLPFSLSIGPGQTDVFCTKTPAEKKETP